MRKFLTSIICFLLPSKLSFWFLNILGHQVSFKTRIGFTFVWMSGKLIMKENTQIGHFNLIKTNNLTIEKGAYLGKYNSIKGPIEIILAETAAIGNRNKIYRAPFPVTYGKAVLQLGILSKITGNHRLDCTRSIIIGDFSTIAGHESQLWTHAYYHDKTGPGRFRVDGEIVIGNNVYIGSRCVISGGVKIANQVSVGANSSISKSLVKAGTYVNQPLRYIESVDDSRSRFKKVDGKNLCEEVYER